MTLHHSSLALALLVIPAAAAAASPAPVGQAGGTEIGGAHYVGVTTEALIVLGQTGDYYDGWVNHGGSLAVYWGHRFHPRFALEVRGAYALHDGAWNNPYADVALVHAAQLTVDAKIPLLRADSVEPYIRGGGPAWR